MTVEQDIAPMSAQDLETRLADLVAGLLEQDSIPVDADFFERGADSLIVIRLVARVRQQLSLDLTPGDVFDHPTAATLAGFLRGGR